MTTLAIGVVLGGTNLRAALIDTSSATPDLSGERKSSHESREPEAIADAIADAVRAIGVEGADAPIGIGLAGMLRAGTGVVVNAPNLGWRDVDLGGLVEARLPSHRVCLINDVGAIALGELRWGAGRGASDLMAVFVGTGIGGGIVVDGAPLSGGSGVAAEIGHVKVVTGPDARPCGCGARGCLEAYAGGRMLGERVRAEIAAGASTLATELAGKGPVHGGHLDQAARAGDPYALALWDEIAPLFGLTLANAVTLLNPERLILGGAGWWGAPSLQDRVLAAYRALGNAPAVAACQVVSAELGDNAGILGAGAFACR